MRACEMLEFMIRKTRIRFDLLHDPSWSGYFTPPMLFLIVLVLASPLTPLGSEYVRGAEPATYDAATIQRNKRWIRIERVAGTHEMLWAQEGGEIEYVHFIDAGVLEHRVGLLPPLRFHQLLKMLETAGLSSQNGLPDSESASGSGPAGGAGYRIALSVDDPLGAVMWEAAPGQPSIASGVANELFKLVGGLKKSDRPGVFLRVGPPTAELPPGLVIPPLTPDRSSQNRSEDHLATMIKELLTPPGRFLSVGSDVRADLPDRLPTDSEGVMWIKEAKRWRPVLTYRRAIP